MDVSIFLKEKAVKMAPFYIAEEEPGDTNDVDGVSSDLIGPSRYNADLI